MERRPGQTTGDAEAGEGPFEYNIKKRLSNTHITLTAGGLDMILFILNAQVLSPFYRKFPEP